MKEIKPSARYDFPKNNKYQLNKGSAKNLEIVFCETKYPDFVKKTNEIIQKKKENPSHQPNAVLSLS